jgi:hypothetical protein
MRWHTHFLMRSHLTPFSMRSHSTFSLRPRIFMKPHIPLHFPFMQSRFSSLSVRSRLSNPCLRSRFFNPSMLSRLLSSFYAVASLGSFLAIMSPKFILRDRPFFFAVVFHSVRSHLILSDRISFTMIAVISSKYAIEFLCTSPYPIALFSDHCATAPPCMRSYLLCRCYPSRMVPFVRSSALCDWALLLCDHVLFPCDRASLDAIGPLQRSRALSRRQHSSFCDRISSYTITVFSSAMVVLSPFAIMALST